MLFAAERSAIRRATVDRDSPAWRGGKRTAMTILYGLEPTLSVDDFVDVLGRSGLAARRPVDDRERIARMLANADIIVVARDPHGVLIGVSRALTDQAFCCYLSDLAVDRAYQGCGIGRELLRRTRAAAGGDVVTMLLLSAPAAMGFYPAAGLDRLDNCFGLMAGDAGRW
jgi:GNAT superfamily N-acetyltransferase